MSEQAPGEQNPENERGNEQLEKEISDIIALIETEEMYAALLEEDEKADLINGLRSLAILDSHREEQQNPKEYILDDQDQIGGIAGMLEQYGLPAEEILVKVGLLE